MTQGDLDFTVPPRTHRDDPETSHAAEKRSQRTWGAKHCELATALAMEPGSTATDLTSFLGDGDGRDIWPHEYHPRLMEVRKRLSDLAHANPPKVRNTPVRGEREGRWYLV